MQLSRRTILRQAAALASVPAANLVTRLAAAGEAGSNDMLIVDTHQHLWDLAQLRLPWLDAAAPVLRKTYHLPEYADATRGLNIKAVYMEVDVADDQHDKEAEHVIDICRSQKAPTVAAVIGGRPAAADFDAYLQRHKASGYVTGVRQVLHGEGTPAGFCLQEDFVRGIRALGKHGLSFDLCMRPGELADGRKLTERCPDTRFVLDHCGNADPKAFVKTSDAKSSHDPQAWRRDIAELARRANVICKISGIVASAPPDWNVDHLAPIVNHCLDSFGPDRVVFGGDWPVCLLGSPLRQWVDALRQIVATRPAADQRRLWSENAVRFYGLKV